MLRIILSLAILNGIFGNPLLTSWLQCTGVSSYDGVTKNNVQTIKYSSDFVYVSGASMPAYTIGPWDKNPNKPSDQKYTYKIRRNPVVSNTKTATRLGTIGLWTNGVSVYNADDGMTYNNQGVWKRNAYYWEKVSFDSCGGHPDQRGSYHNHIVPTCLFDYTDSSKHSPIIGWAFDGYPIYGPYGYSSANVSSSPIKKIRSSYRTRTFANNKRTTMPDGSTASLAGPDVSSTYPAGAFLADFEYVKEYGDLDEYNGRFTVTSDFPLGTYAYYATIDTKDLPEYPFVIGPNYYGVPITLNSATITESTQTYFSYS